jgi:hypothetical protein
VILILWTFIFQYIFISIFFNNLNFASAVYHSIAPSNTLFKSQVLISGCWCCLLVFDILISWHVSKYCHLCFSRTEILNAWISYSFFNKHLLSPYCMSDSQVLGISER